MPAFGLARLSGPAGAVKGSLRRASPALDRALRNLLVPPNPLVFQKRQISLEVQRARVAYTIAAHTISRHNSPVYLSMRPATKAALTSTLPSLSLGSDDPTFSVLHSRPF